MITAPLSKTADSASRSEAHPPEGSSACGAELRSPARMVGNGIVFWDYLARMYSGEQRIQAAADWLYARHAQWALDEARDGGRPRKVIPRDDSHWRRRAIARLRDAGLLVPINP